MSNFFNELVSMAFEASILIVAVIAIRQILRKMPKYFRKIFWVLAGIKLVVPYSPQSALSLMPQNTGAATQNVIASTAPMAEMSKAMTFVDFLPYIWLAVAFLMLLYGVISFVKLKLKISDAVRDSSNIFLSEKVDSPFVCGFLKPKIYLPYNIDGETKDYVLQHERHHIKNGDHILKAIGFLIVCVYWFNPLVWIAYFLFCKDIELACDEGVIKNYSEDKRKKYAGAILEIGVSKVKLSACPVAFGEVGIKERVMSAVNYRKVTKAFVCLCVAICVTLAVCFMTEPVDDKLMEKQPTEKTDIAAPLVTEPPTEQATEPVTEEVREEVTEIATENVTKKSAESATKKSSSSNTSKKEPIEIPPLEFPEPFKYYDDEETEPKTTTAEMQAILNSWGVGDNVEYDIYDEEENDSPYAAYNKNTPATTKNNYEVDLPNFTMFY